MLYLLSVLNKVSFYNLVFDFHSMKTGPTGANSLFMFLGVSANRMNVNMLLRDMICQCGSRVKITVVCFLPRGKGEGGNYRID